MRLVLLVAISLSGCDCSGGENNDGSDPDQMWAEPTHPTTEQCEGCEEITLGQLGHGPDGTFLTDREADDVITQWEKCMHGYMDCVDAGGDENSCIASAPCPGACRARYAELVADAGGDLEAKFAAIDAVFFNEDALCKPSGVAGVDSVPTQVMP